MRSICPHSGGGCCAGAEGGGFTRKQFAGWQGHLAYLGAAAALIGAPRRCFLQVTGNLERSGMMGIASNSARRSGRKAENPGAWVLTTN